jgi:hypothetical protein
MAKTSAQIQGISEALGNASGSLVALSKIDAPYTTITKRAQVTDLANDLLPRMGVQRISAQDFQEKQSESGPNGEKVWGLLNNDAHDTVRFVGVWTNSIGSTTPGRIRSGAANDFVEITYYGTGLNLLTNGSASQDFRETTDGGAESGNLATATASNIMNARGYSPNVVIPIKAGLTLGLHTTKIRTNTGSLDVHGFEVLNEASTLKTPPGTAYSNGKKQYLSAVNSQAYNSSFESGTLGTRGGRVLTYLLNGEVKKAVTPTDSSALTLSSTNHANEELIRSYHFREFGAARSDDFSLQTTAAATKAFTLNDGTTTLGAVSIQNSSAADAIELLVNGTGYVYFTFVGTGLDVLTKADVAGSNTLDVTIDGGSVQTLVNANTDKTRILKIVSGLPYGTHTVKILRNTVTSSTPRFTNFLVYGPKKPTLPANAIELADYFIMADHTTLAAEGANTVSSGVLRKQNTREFNYSGTWTHDVVLAANVGFSGFATFTTTQNSYFEYTFVGTGFDLRVNSEATFTGEIRVDGSANLSGFTTSTSGGALSFTASTGQFSGNTGTGARITVKDLTYGKHTIKVTKIDAGAGGLYPDGLDIITPIHSYASVGVGVLQSVLVVGNQGISDNRALPDSATLEIPNWAQSVGVATNPSTSSSTAVPMPDMNCVVKTTGKPLDILFSGTFNMTSGAYVIASFAIYVDGVQIVSRDVSNQTSTGRVTLSMGCIASVPAGVHIVQVLWSSDGTNSLGSVSNLRTLCAKEL